MRNLFAIAALLAATSSAFDYETLASYPLKYLSRAQQTGAESLNKKTRKKPSTRPARRDYSRPIKEPE